jgi:hypothetical protein
MRSSRLTTIRVAPDPQRLVASISVVPACRRRSTLVAALLGVALLASGFRAPSPSMQDGGPLALWVQLGPDGAASARAIAAAATCPAIDLDGRVQPMQVRAQPAPPDFPVLTCEAAIPPGTTAASVEGQALPLPPADPRRIVVLGDTGCLLEDGTFQACNDPQAWPFAQIAASAAAWQPDLVIHVGDHLYRKVACPAGNAGCANSPSGDTWASWRADLFEPAAPLSRVAPWVLARGNHDDCVEPGHLGWFRFLDPRPMAASCQGYTEPYAVPLGNLQLLVLDSALADDEKTESDVVVAYQAQFATLRNLAGPNAWLVGHRPMWAVQNDSTEPGTEQLGVLNATLQAASGNELPPGVRLVVTGHMHLVELLGFAGGRPPQFVVGNGGVALDPPVTSSLVGREVAGATVASAKVVYQWGYLTMERDEEGWTAVARDPAGGAVTSCAVRDVALTCTP